MYKKQIKLSLIFDNMILFVSGLFDYASLKIIVYRKISELLTDSDLQFYKNILENGAQQSI